MSEEKVVDEPVEEPDAAESDDGKKSPKPTKVIDGYDELNLEESLSDGCLDTIEVKDMTEDEVEE